MSLLHLRVLDSQEVPEIQDFMDTSWLEHKADRQEALLEGSRARRSRALQLLRHRRCLCEPRILCAQHVYTREKNAQREGAPGRVIQSLNS